MLVKNTVVGVNCKVMIDALNQIQIFSSRLGVLCAAETLLHEKWLSSSSVVKFAKTTMTAGAFKNVC